jgi:hypothetical protein
MMQTLLHYPLPICAVANQLVASFLATDFRRMLDPDRPRFLVIEGHGDTWTDNAWVVRHFVILSDVFDGMPDGVRQAVARLVFDTLATKLAPDEQRARWAMRSLRHAHGHTWREAAWMGYWPMIDSQEDPKAHHDGGETMPDHPKRPVPAMFEPAADVAEVSP